MTKKNQSNKTRKTNSKTQVSAIKGLYPYMVIDHDTGEVLEESFWSKEVTRLVCYVTEKATCFVEEEHEAMEKAFEDGKCPSQPTGIAHTYGITPDMTDLPDECLAKSRIRELIEHKGISEYRAYHDNSSDNKQKPTFSDKINLGAVNNQMAKISVSLEERVICLSWKCWTCEMDFFFMLPEYLIDYNIKKFSKPTVQLNDEKRIVFFFSVTENLSYRIDSKNPKHQVIILGYDLGRVVPFAGKVVSDNGKTIATFEASGRLKKLNQKRENILANKKNAVKKRDAYRKQHIFPDKVKTLDKEIDCLADKAKRLGRETALLTGSEIAVLSSKYSADVVVGEDLTWVNDAHGSSRWVHGECEDAISHAVRRDGAKHFVANAAYSSQECSRCGSRNVVLKTDRTIHCKDCDYDDDRDVNAGGVMGVRRAKIEHRTRMKKLNMLRKDGRDKTMS